MRGVNSCSYLHTMEKQSRIVKFSISIRKDTRTLIDKLANQENRSRSAMIDVVCTDACKKLLLQEKR